jgi:hypothetical protein
MGTHDCLNVRQLLCMKTAGSAVSYWTHRPHREVADIVTATSSAGISVLLRVELPSAGRRRMLPISVCSMCSVQLKLVAKC